MMPTKRALDGFRFANELNLDNYSALVAVGGDGSISEVVNGMLARTDGKRLPVGFIPNGSTNWHGVMLGTFTVEMALDAIINRTVSQFSVMECLADLDDVSTVAPGLEGFS